MAGQNNLHIRNIRKIDLICGMSTSFHTSRRNFQQVVPSIRISSTFSVPTNFTSIKTFSPVPAGKNFGPKKRLNMRYTIPNKIYLINLHRVSYTSLLLPWIKIKIYFINQE